MTWTCTKINESRWLLTVLRIPKSPGRKYLIKKLCESSGFSDHLLHCDSQLDSKIRLFGADSFALRISVWTFVTAGTYSSLKQLHHGFVTVRGAHKNSWLVDSKHFSWNWPDYLLAICYTKWSCNKLIRSPPVTFRQGSSNITNPNNICSGQINKIPYKHVFHLCPFLHPFQLMGNFITAITPPKFNMEPENDGFQEELRFLGTSFQVPC